MWTPGESVLIASVLVLAIVSGVGKCLILGGGGGECFFLRV